MSTLQRLIGGVIRLVVKRRARGLELTQMLERLEVSKRVVQARFQRCRDTPSNREAMNHVIGIERWGQSRLRVFLGAPLAIDSYRSYRLPEGSSVEEFRPAFSETRDQTIVLARDLAERAEISTATVRHNDLGELTAVEWLVYLDDHAKRESLRVRG